MPVSVLDSQQRRTAIKAAPAPRRRQIVGYGLACRQSPQDRRIWPTFFGMMEPSLSTTIFIPVSLMILATTGACPTYLNPSLIGHLAVSLRYFAWPILHLSNGKLLPVKSVPDFNSNIFSMTCVPPRWKFRHAHYIHQEFQLVMFEKRSHLHKHFFQVNQTTIIARQGMSRRLASQPACCSSTRNPNQTAIINGTTKRASFSCSDLCAKRWPMSNRNSKLPKRLFSRWYG